MECLHTVIPALLPPALGIARAGLPSPGPTIDGPATSGHAATPSVHVQELSVAGEGARHTAAFRRRVGGHCAHDWGELALPDRARASPATWLHLRPAKALTRLYGTLSSQQGLPVAPVTLFL